MIKIIKKANKYNLTNGDGEIISQIWFDSISGINKEYHLVELDHEWNIIDDNGTLMWHEWYHKVKHVVNGISIVGNIYGYWNWSSIDGRLISDRWYHSVSNFKNGYARVGKNDGEWNLVDFETGNLVSDAWFDFTNDFSDDGFARVIQFDKFQLNGLELKTPTFNLIDKNGKLVNSTWVKDSRDLYKKN